MRKEAGQTDDPERDMKMHFHHVRFSEHKPDMRYHSIPFRRRVATARDLRGGGTYFRHAANPPFPAAGTALQCSEVRREEDDGAIHTDFGIAAAEKETAPEGDSRRFKLDDVSLSDVSETNTISLPPPAHLVNLSTSLGRENGH